jgi:hypothetical protein
VGAGPPNRPTVVVTASAQDIWEKARVSDSLIYSALGRGVWLWIATAHGLGTAGGTLDAPSERPRALAMVGARASVASRNISVRRVECR